MKRRHTIAALAAAALLAALSAPCPAQEAEYFGTIMMHDGTSIVPNRVVPTPAEVAAAQSAAQSAATAAGIATATNAVLLSTAARLEVAAGALDGAAILYGSCVAFGSQAVEASTNATARLLAINLSSNVAGVLYVDLYTWFSEPPASLPEVDHAQALPAADPGGWTQLEDLGTVLTTFPVEGVDTECYRSTVGVPGADAAGFFRVRGEAQQTVVGQLLVIYDGLTVNGVRGITTTVPGLGTFYDGLLMEEVEGE